MWSDIGCLAHHPVTLFLPWQPQGLTAWLLVRKRGGKRKSGELFVVSEEEISDVKQLKLLRLTPAKISFPRGQWSKTLIAQKEASPFPSACVMYGEKNESTHTHTPTHSPIRYIWAVLSSALRPRSHCPDRIPNWYGKVLESVPFLLNGLKPRAALSLSLWVLHPF